MVRTAIVTLMLMTSLLAAPAQASTGSAPDSDSCVSLAVQRNLDAWVCLGQTLTYTDGGKVKRESLPAAASDAPLAISPMAITPEPTNYDTYCDYGRDTCTGYASRYISWTKGNALYGNSNGAIGSFDVVLRTNLNGRQPRYTTRFFHDSGPGLSFSGTIINCREDNTGPDSNCGNFGAFSGSSSYTLGTGNFASSTIYGNRLNDSNDYFSTIAGYFTPTGYPRFTMSELRSGQMNCFGSDNCYFRDA